MKTTHLTALRSILIALFAAALPTLALAETTTGTVENVIGDAKVVLPNGKSEPLTKGSTVPVGSKIETAPDSKAVMAWTPGAMSVIGANSTVAINSLAYSAPNGVPQRKVGLGLTKGTLFNHLAHNSGKSDFRIKTPTGVAAARGTDWSVTITDSGKTEILTVTSAVDYTDTVGGFTVTVTANHFYITDSTNHTPQTMTQAQIDAIIQELRSNGITVDTTFMPQVDGTGPPPTTPLGETPLTKGQYQPNTGSNSGPSSQ